ncbi:MULTISPECIES: hypothetical protein [Hyphomonas]|uniref:hypothetical protein n=1 Tax=Hyphomonas TaxID=85 RepID=UPI003512133A
MSGSPPPEFGPNGAVLNSPSMTDEMRTQYIRAATGEVTWQSAWLPWGLVFLVFVALSSRFDWAHWLVLLPGVAIVSLMALRLCGVPREVQRRWSQRGWIVSLWAFCNANWLLYYEVPVWLLCVPNGLVLASIFRNLGSRSRVEQGIWIGIMLACILALPSFAERV